MIRLPRKTALLILVLLIVISAANCAFLNGGSGESKINWLYDWNEVLSKAQAENKPIMINFYTDWCVYCRKLDSDTYSDDELSAFLNDNFICLKSNADKSNLHNIYNVDAYPWIVFTSPEGTKLGQIVGYKPPGYFYQYALGILGQWEP